MGAISQDPLSKSPFRKRHVNRLAQTSRADDVQPGRRTFDALLADTFGDEASAEAKLARLVEPCGKLTHRAQFA